jgi:hypothetical protein
VKRLGLTVALKDICASKVQVDLHMLTETQNRGLKFAYFILGVAVPLAGFFLWWRNGANRKNHLDKAHDITVEDSFPASDPPSAW